MLRQGVPAVPSTDIVKHLEEWRAVVRSTLDVLYNTAELTPVGAVLLAEVDDALEASKDW
ncbi:Uncharacterised protein [Dermatophilus congolensis]|uniref:Uncharacterized protein n=1 Tax=Dermatophilus congolensis TaxID=1863 RepID=A0A239V4Q4_9MICO|nr:Uncharacterised protein [Dermatophilus congolensis]